MSDRISDAHLAHVASTATSPDAIGAVPPRFVKAMADELISLRADRDRAEIAEIQALLDAVRAGLRNVEAERDAYRAMLCDLLASAHQHPTEHPTMAAQWARARELLKNGPGVERDAARAETERWRPVVEAAKEWRDTWRHRAPFGAESNAVALVDAVDAALAGRWARCEEPPQADRVTACGWTGEMRQLRRDRDGVTRCPACGSTAIVEDLAPPQGANRG